MSGRFCLAASHDIRAAIIKLADRIHNMRTLEIPAAGKTAPHCAGNYECLCADRTPSGNPYCKGRRESEDPRFHYLDSYAYSEIEHIMEIKKRMNGKVHRIHYERIRKRLAQEHFAKEPIIEGRVKSIYGIYKKVYVNHKGMDEIYDKYAVRVIVSTVAECYMVLGIVHDMFRPCRTGSRTISLRRSPICISPCTPQFWDGRAFLLRFRFAPGICTSLRNTASLLTEVQRGYPGQG